MGNGSFYRNGILAFAALVVAIGSSPVWAQESDYLPTEVEMSDEEAESGWDYLLSIGAGLSFASSQNVVGNTDGNSWTVMLTLDGALTYLSGPHEWRNLLLLSETFARTPVIDQFVKSSDILALESLYLFHIPSAPWFGPFGRVTLDTSVFPGYDVQAGDVDYVISYPNGSTELVNSDHLRVTDPFQPLTLTETVGVFFTTFASEAFNNEVLAGFGARQTFASGQRAVLDDDTTPEIEVVLLESFNQAGVAALTNFWGQLEEGRVSYRAGVEVMIPVINDLAPDDNRSSIDLTNIDAFAGISFKLVDWASLDYAFMALREPQLIDVWQLQHNLLLTFSYVLID